MGYQRKTNSSNYQTNLIADERCPILHAYNLIEGRWKIHVLWYIQDRPLRFSEITKAIPLATERMIARRLTELLDQELIEIGELKKNKVYQISAKGRMLIPVLQMMYKTGEKIQKG